MDMKYMYKKALSKEDKEEMFKAEHEKKDKYQLAHCNGYKRIYPHPNTELNNKLDKILKTSCNTKETKKVPNIKNFLGSKIKEKLDEKENADSKTTDENKVTKSKEEVHSIVNRLY